MKLATGLTLSTKLINSGLFAAYLTPLIIEGLREFVSPHQADSGERIGLLDGTSFSSYAEMIAEQSHEEGWITSYDVCTDKSKMPPRVIFFIEFREVDCVNVSRVEIMDLADAAQQQVPVKVDWQP